MLVLVRLFRLADWRLNQRDLSGATAHANANANANAGSPVLVTSLFCPFCTQTVRLLYLFVKVCCLFAMCILIRILIYLMMLVILFKRRKRTRSPASTQELYFKIQTSNFKYKIIERRVERRSRRAFDDRYLYLDRETAISLKIDFLQLEKH